MSISNQCGFINHCRVAILIIIGLAFQNCATIFSDSVYTMPVDSSPQGADVTAFVPNGNTLAEFKTPGEFEIDYSDPSTRDSMIIVKFEKAGFEESRLVVRKKIDPTAFADLACLSFSWIPGIIDFLTGNLFMPDRKKIFMKLKVKKQEPTKAEED